jgi:ADP-ribose pyrophosphatase YjhB (NUDIX family)
MTTAYFQAGIGALIWHEPTQAYLLLKRSQTKDVGAGAWECVTGRLEQGEDYEAALQREVLKELSVKIQVDFIVGTSHFYRGEAIPENELLSVIYACSIDNRDLIQISHEHSEHRWLTVAEAFTFLSQDHWLVQSIHRAESIRSLTPPSLRDFYRSEGFRINF